VSPICQQCKAHKKTVTHYLLFCTKYHRQRQILRQELGQKVSNIGYLLSNKNALLAIFRYIAATQCFEKTHRNLMMEGEHEEDAKAEN
jgi:hypothetical protein